MENAENAKGSSGRRTLNRRSFLKASAASLAALSLAGCAPRRHEEGEKALSDIGASAEPEGVWKSATCWAHCGGRCALKAYVVDGVAVRVKTDDTHEDSQDWPQRRACLRGRSRIKDVYSPYRMRYPMKRKNWAPGGGANSQGELRGRDEWERISWDEALDLVADEVKRIRETYGNNSIYGHRSIVIQGETIQDMSADEGASYHIDEFGSFFMRGMDFGSALAVTGGFTQAWTTASEGAFANAHVYGFGTNMGTDFMNDRIDCRNCETVIMFGLNPAYGSDPTSFWANWLPVRDSGAKFICIDPMYTDACSILGGEWVPIRPSTDTALLLAMAYVMITEDDPDSNPLIDWDVIKRCSIGFDADSMPEGEDPKGNFKDHVLGTYDGQPKDPAWASAITGISEDKIKELGRLAGKDNKLALLTSWGVSRNHNAEGFVQAFMCVGAMGGHFGRSGHMMASAVEDAGMNGGDFLVTPGSRDTAFAANEVDDCFHGPTLWQDILKGKYLFRGNGESGQVCPTEEREINIQCIYLYASDPVHSYENSACAIEALRSVEFVVSHNIMFDDSARFADIVLPLITPWEKSPEYLMFTNPTAGFCKDQVIDPIFEAKNERWVGRELCNRWGVNGDEVFPEDDLTLSFRQISSVNTAVAPGEYKPLCSFTEEEAAEFGEAGEAREEGVISYTEFKENGVYTVPRTPGDGFESMAYVAFREDPEGNPMKSESGKFEFYCRAITQMSREHGVSEVPPVATYIPSPGGFEDTFSDYAAGTKGEFPFQVFNPHYLRSAHYHFDNVPWMREALARPLYVNTQDAEQLGVKEGDTVVVRGTHGAVLRPVCVTGRIMPGVVALPHGGKFEYDEELKMSLGGNDNFLTAPVSTGMGVSGYNTQKCAVEKYAGEPLVCDGERELSMPQCQGE